MREDVTHVTTSLIGRDLAQLYKENEPGTCIIVYSKLSLLLVIVRKLIHIKLHVLSEHVMTWFYDSMWTHYAKMIDQQILQLIHIHTNSDVIMGDKCDKITRFQPNTVMGWITFTFRIKHLWMHAPVILPMVSHNWWLLNRRQPFFMNQQWVISPMNIYIYISCLNICITSLDALTICGLVTPQFDVIELGQSCSRLWFVAWWHQAISLTNAVYSNAWSCGNAHGVFPWQVWKLLI